MMKIKSIFQIISFVVLITGCLLLGACFKKEPETLSTPIVVLNDNGAEWSRVPNATRLEISIDGKLSYLESAVTSYPLEDGQAFRIRAIGDGTNYTDGEWSNTVTFKKQVAEPNTYTVTWMSDGRTIETDNNVKEGEIPSYNGTTPRRDNDAQYSYVFRGWSPEIQPVTKDVVYTAQFTVVVNKYTVTWMNDSTVLYGEEVEFGTTPIYKGTTPIKENTTQYQYTFKGWSPEILPVSSNITYYAQFDATLKLPTITWKNGGVTIETDLNVEYGTLPTYDGPTPTKEGNPEFSYLFTGWSPVVMQVTEDATYEAVFEAVVNKYTVTWQNEDNTLIVDKDIPYGTVPTYNGPTPTKEGNAQYKYTFTGWDKTIAPLTGDITYYAKYQEVINKYTVTWQNEAQVLKTEEVEYGTLPTYNGPTPTKERTPQYTYTFSSWSPEINVVSKDITYYATYKETVNLYTVTFYGDDGTTILDTVKAYYGEDATYSKLPPVKNSTEGYDYTFDKWVTTINGNEAAVLTNITSNKVVYAKFNEIVRLVNVTIITNDESCGNVSIANLTSIPYGTRVVIDNNTIEIAGQRIIATPSERNSQYSYQFINWSTPLSIGSNTIITANFTKTVNKYTITWKNGDDVIKVDEDIAYGTTPVYTGPTPTKAPEGEIYYTFSGWNPAISIVTGDKTYTAKFIDALNKYTVTFYDSDGVTVLGKEIVESGSDVVYQNALPTKDATISIIYTFDKWVTTLNGDEEANLTNILKDINVYAKYTSSVREYEITFKDYDGTVIESNLIPYGTQITLPENPERDGYRFDGWDKEVTTVSGDMVIVATYVQQFTVKFVDYDESIIEIQIIDYGQDATVPTDPERINYSFVGWNTTFTNVLSDLTIKAQYVRQYKVTFYNYDGTLISTVTVDSGADAPQPEDPTREGFTFTGWDLPLENITSNTEITAQFTINRYTVTFVNPNNEVLKVVPNIKHGFPVEAPIPDEMYFDWKTLKGYRFTGWNQSLDAIVDKTTITAVYGEEITEPIIAIETIKITKGTTSAPVRIYLCGIFGKIHGISLSVSYDTALSLNGSTAIKINEEFSSSQNTQSTLDNIKHQYDLSWVSGDGKTINGYLETGYLLMFTFSVDQTGEYLIDMLANTYFINENLEKVTPIIVVGKVIVTE